MNFVLAIIVFSSITFFEGLPKIVNEPIISSVYQNVSEEDESPAYKIGLKKDDRIINMSLNNSPEANGKAFGLAKLSSNSTSLLIRKLEYFILKGDLNQNYYGMIRLAVEEIEYHCIISDRNNLLEINTVSDLNTVNNTISASSISISD